MSATTAPFTLRLPDDIRNDLEFLSRMSRRSQSSIASEILQEKISIKAERMKKIQAARLQAEQGAFISQSAMEQWVDALGTDPSNPAPQADYFHK
ncbi:hypothetical protein MK079_04480 [Candidatus Gracilibacteria bacterium]|nr:hypothetical protein [Candidatus Gracilibacteria bacterium]